MPSVAAQDTVLLSPNPRQEVAQDAQNGNDFEACSTPQRECNKGEHGRT